MISDSVVGMGDEAFFRCTDLKGVVIGRGLTHMGKLPFKGCTSLELFDVSEDNKSFATVDGILYDKGMETLLDCPSAMKGEVIVPDGVCVIGDQAFSYCSGITSLILPESLESIGNMAFSLCSSLKEMYIPDMVVSIGSAPFSGCSSMEYISVGAGNGDYVSIDGVLFTRDMRSMIRYPSMKSGKEYVIPEGVESIDRTAFMKCKELEVITVPEPVTFVDKFGFAGSKCLKRIVFLGSNPELYVEPSAFSFLSEGVVFERDGKEYDTFESLMLRTE